MKFKEYELVKILKKISQNKKRKHKTNKLKK